MKIPDSIDIGGKTYSVRIKDIADAGYADLERHVIYINERLCPREQEATFIHEVIEVINNDCEFSLAHQTICTFETLLYQVVQQLV